MTNNLSKTLDLSPIVPSALGQVPPEYQMALLRPRRWDTITARLLSACDGVSFAKEAYFRRPGSTALQLSCHFVELAQSIIGNLSVECVPEPPYDDTYRMTVIDLESNSKQSVVFRTTGHGALKPQLVKRGLIASFIPSELRSLCLQRCRELVSKEDSKDTAAAAKSLALSFTELGIESGDLKAFIGRPLPSATAKDIETLRCTLLLLRDGEITWQDVTGGAPLRAEPASPKPKEAAKPRAKKAAPGSARPRAARVAVTPPPSEQAPSPPKPRASLRDEDEDPPPVVSATSSDATLS